MDIRFPTNSMVVLYDLVVKIHYWLYFRFVEIKSKEREPFIEALLKLRPELKNIIYELNDQLEILNNDIADLLRLMNISGEPIRE